MSRRQPFFSSSVGSKYLKAFTGLSLLGYDSAEPGVRVLWRTLAVGFLSIPLFFLFLGARS